MACPRSRPPRNSFAMCSVAALLAVLTAPLWAAEELASGVRYSVSGGFHVVEVDLGAEGVEAHVSTPRGTQGNRLTIAGHGQADDALVAINANYAGGGPQHPYDFPCGAARGAGKQFADAYEEAGNCVTTLGWTPGHGEIIFSGGHAADPGFLSQYPDLVTGGGYLLSSGQRMDWNHAKLESGRACTAVGMSADRRRLILVVSDQGVCSGASLQRVLLDHGASDAVHLDGGGSSKIWIRGRGYVNRVSQDRLLPVGIIVKAKGSGGGGGGGHTSCPSGNGLYCGGNHIEGDPAVLYRCAGGALEEVRRCAAGCRAMPPGVDDHCAGGGRGGCPSGNGLYCGGNQIPGDSQSLYQCRGGDITLVMRCPSGCVAEPPGVSDHCTR